MCRIGSRGGADDLASAFPSTNERPSPTATTVSVINPAYHPRSDTFVWTEPNRARRAPLGIVFNNISGSRGKNAFLLRAQVAVVGLVFFRGWVHFVLRIFFYFSQLRRG
jgi:hypothetical protein